MRDLSEFISVHKALHNISYRYLMNVANRQSSLANRDIGLWDICQHRLNIAVLQAIIDTLMKGAQLVLLCSNLRL